MEEGRGGTVLHPSSLLPTESQPHCTVALNIFLGLLFLNVVQVALVHHLLHISKASHSLQIKW